MVCISNFSLHFQLTFFILPVLCWYKDFILCIMFHSIKLCYFSIIVKIFALRHCSVIHLHELKMIKLSGIGYSHQHVTNTFSIILLLFFKCYYLSKFILKYCLWKYLSLTLMCFGMMKGTIFTLCSSYIRNLWEIWLIIPYKF